MENRQLTDVNDQEGNKTGSFMCRQTSARWTPTADQIRILKELYYGAGVRSPSTEQIQTISARLRQYGKIEGKNVFYWFQNHKARERHKRRFGTTTAMSSSSQHAHQHHHHHHHHASNIPMQRAPFGNNNNTHLHSKIPNIGKGCYHAISGSEFVINAANVQMESYGYGSVTMERHFRDCSISQIGSSNDGTMKPHVPVGRAFMDHHCYNFLDKPKPLIDLEGQEEDDDDEGAAYHDGAAYDVDAVRTTLPLFPMNGQDQVINGGRFFISNGGYVNSSPYASLELSLNSYTGVTQD